MAKKPVVFKGVEFSKYEVDERGNVFRKGSVTPLKPFDDARGYNRVDLMNDNNEKVMCKIHLIVAHTFLGEQKEGMIVNHKDGNKRNNATSNLEYISQRENVAHAQVLIKKKDYLSEDIVKTIRSKAKHQTITEIAEEMGLQRHVVRDLLSGKTYTYVAA